MERTVQAAEPWEWAVLLACLGTYHNTNWKTTVLVPTKLV